MHSRSAILFLFALFVRSVHATDPNGSSPNVVAKRDSENESLHKRAALPGSPDSLTGLVEIRGPSDFDHIARSPTPASATEPDLDSEPELKLDSAPAPEAATKPKALGLRSDPPSLDYEGTHCPAYPKPSARGCACDGQSLCKYNTGDQGICYFLQSSNASCGECFKKCGSRQQCKYGTCKCVEEGKTACDSKCVDTRTDSKNCGTCGHGCGYPKTCSNGKCVHVK